MKSQASGLCTGAADRVEGGSRGAPPVAAMDSAPWHRFKHWRLADG